MTTAMQTPRYAPEDSAAQYRTFCEKDGRTPAKLWGAYNSDRVLVFWSTTKRDARRSLETRMSSEGWTLKEVP